jgi:hypothetical protein
MQIPLKIKGMDRTPYDKAIEYTPPTDRAGGKGIHRWVKKLMIIERGKSRELKAI